MPETTAKLGTGVGIKTILLAEDDLPLLQAMRDILELSGYDIISVSNGKDLVTTFASEKGRISLILSDNQMPEMTGIQAIPQLKEINPDVLIVICSANPGNEELVKLQQGGQIFGSISKPFDASCLEKMVEKALGRSANQEP